MNEMTTVNAKKINLDAMTATWLLNEVSPFAADRQLSKLHVAKLVSEMRCDHFLPEITTVMVAKLDSQTYRINGQHTAMAVLEMVKDDANFVLRDVTLLEFEVQSEGELRKLYARIDRGAARSNKDVVKSILSGTDEFSGVQERVLNLLPLGLAFWRFEDSNKRKLYVGETAALDVQEKYLALSQMIAVFMGELDYKAQHHGHMFRSPVVAAFYATFSVDVADAERFWQAVATGVGFESEDEPAARLRQMLKSVNIGGGILQRGSKGAIGAENMYRACLHAWNRFRLGGEFKQSLRPTVLASRPAVK